MKRVKGKTGKYLDKNLGIIGVSSSAGFIGGASVAKKENKRTYG